MEQLIMQIVESLEFEKLDSGVSPDTATVKDIEIYNTVRKHVEQVLNALVSAGELRVIETMNNRNYAIGLRENKN